MSAYGDNPEFHRIVDERFVCSAPADAPCRTFPTCECESWCCCGITGESHDDGDHCCMSTVKPGQGCWIEPWVNASGLEDCYASDPLSVWVYDSDGETSWPDGAVTCDWEGDFVAWEYVR